MIGEGLRSENLELCFEKLLLRGVGVGVGRENNMESGGGVVAEWKDLPMELLLRIVSLVDDRTVIIASGVCTGWRDAICLGLTHLSLSWCKNNMNNLVLALSPKFTKLQVLSLRQTKPQLEDGAVEAVANFCHELRDLDLSKSFKLTDLSLYALAHGCPRLTKLNISGCTAFSDVALAYLTGFCRNLKSLNLCGCGKAASDRALQAIAYNCSKLQYLNLGWCEFVGDVGVKSLAFGCPDLRELDLCGCCRITDDSVIALANGCLYLRSLDLYYCQNITDRAMYSLADRRMKGKRDLWKPVESRYDEGLVNLNLGQCTALTAQAVQAVCDSFPSLHTCWERQSLTISGCLNLTSVHCACTTGTTVLYKPHVNVRSDSEMFVLPGLPDHLETCRSKLPEYFNKKTFFGDVMRGVLESVQGSYGVVMNSFFELEPAYVEHYKKYIKAKAWTLGPVFLCNNINRDDQNTKSKNNKKAFFHDDHEFNCLSWLDTKKPNSVLYICFGGTILFSNEQLVEIALGLEASDCSFIWVVRQNQEDQNDDEEETMKWLPEGLEEKMKIQNKGLIIRGWAPQKLILEHQAIGGFLTHVGWNSVLESLISGVPMITWPLFAEQFFNEKLVIEVLKIGFEVGVGNWGNMDATLNVGQVAVKKEKIEKAVRRLMGGSIADSDSNNNIEDEEVKKMRKRVREIGELGKQAVGEGGSSHSNFISLIQELKLCRKKSPTTLN